MSEQGVQGLEAVLLGESPVMRALRADIVRYGASRLPILIEGPTGAGKELVASALHATSRRSGELVAFNVCAVGDGMFEDALFGHVKGGFTGATRDAAGYLAEANGGTVFMDEISGLGLQSQAKLLRALETGVFRPVGAARDRVSDFRLVSASNEDLGGMVARRSFRLDLLQRIGGHVLDVPSLDSRREDIPQLVRHFLRDGRLLASISDEAIARLQSHVWGGNVRQLRHAVQRLAIVAGGDEIGAGHVEEALRSRSEVGMSRSAEALSVERITAALECHQWDIERAADALHVHRATLYRWMRRCGIEMPSAARLVRKVAVIEPGRRLTLSRDAGDPVASVDALSHSRRTGVRQECDGNATSRHRRIGK